MREEDNEMKGAPREATAGETNSLPRDYVMRLYRKSLAVYDALYKKLAQREGETRA